MKQLFLIGLLVATAVTALGTAQTPEQINDNGVDKKLAAYLLELDSATFSMLWERIPDKPVSTDLWRRYIGHWKIRNDSLFLDSVLVMGTDRFEPAIIDDIYSSRLTPSGYFADWVTDSLRIVSGEIIRYEHMGWASDWENEEYVTVKDGLIKDRTVYKNRVVNPIGVNYDSIKSVIDSLDLGFIPKMIVLRLEYDGFDENGTATGYKAEVIRSCGDTAVDDRVVRAITGSTKIFKMIPIYYIRGQYKAPGLSVKIPASPAPRHSSN